MRLNIYTRLEELPFVSFVEIAVTKDLIHLFKGEKGEITQEVIETWERMYMDYAAILGGNDFIYMLNLSVKISNIKLRIEAINAALYQLAIYKSEALIDSLRDIGYDFDKDNWEQSVNRIRSKAKGLLIELRQAEAEIESLNNPSTNKQPTREYFDALIDSYERYKGFPLPENISTYRFATTLLRMQEQIKRKEKNG